MPFIIESILPQNQALATANENHSIQDAISIMIERDFSQLVVVDQHGKLKGLVTSDSILKALSFCETTVSQLKVSHALIKIKAYRIDEDLSELLKGLRDINAVPIVDKQGFPKAIVTSFDTTGYFRARAEDIMVAEDVETTLRDFIESFYKNSGGDVDESKLQEAIKAIMPSGQDVEKRFKKALRQYLGQSGLGQNAFDQELASQVFADCLAQQNETKAFGQLTLSEYVQLFRNVWEHYQSSFKGIEWKALDKLLDSARLTRNDIAHFREVTPQKREQLKFCAEFLDRHRPSIAITNLDEKANGESSYRDEQRETVTPSVFVPPPDTASFSESRYAPLAVWLQEKDQDKIALTFSDVENIIQDTLPASARRHRAWWANDTAGHSQSLLWLEAGWKVSSINLSEEKVIFSRISERKAAYANFFNTLQPKLESIPGFSIRLITNPQGGFWITFEIIADGFPAATYHLSFARGSKFYLGQYIAMGDRQLTEQVFDKVHAQRSTIEAEFGGPLSWERLMGQQSAKIAVYRENSSITSDPEAWEEIYSWVLETLPSFYKALAKPYDDALEDASASVMPIAMPS
jgi:CBS domain-containing protein